MRNTRAKKFILIAAFIIIVLSSSIVLASQRDITWFSLFESSSYKIMLEGDTKKLEKKDDTIFLSSDDLKAMLIEKYGTSEIYTELTASGFTPDENGIIALPISEDKNTYTLSQMFFVDEKGWTANIIVLAINDEKYLSILDDKAYNSVLGGIKPSPHSRLINRDNTLPDGYNDDNIVPIKDVQAVLSSKGMKLDKVTLDALKIMLEKANSDGAKGFILNSTYRPYKEQKGLFDYRFNERKAAGVANPYEEASKVVAYPGTSEHQTGMALDILSLEYPKGSTFHNSKEYEWLKENCWDFGFIPRYPEDKMDITRISFEPWHYRYIGKPLSLYAKQNNLCLEEVVENLQKNKLTSFEVSNEEKYTFLLVKKGQEFMIQDGLNMEYSLFELTELEDLIIIRGVVYENSKHGMGIYKMDTNK